LPRASILDRRGLSQPPGAISISFFSFLLAFSDRICQMKLVEICDLLDSAEMRDQIHSDLNQAGEEQTDLKTLIADLLQSLQSDNCLYDEQLADQSRREQPSNLIPHDEDHAGDPMSFVPIFHSESTRIEIFQ
jgi:hypothetical protein